MQGHVDITHRLRCTAGTEELGVEQLDLLWLKAGEWDATQRRLEVVANDLRVADERARAQR